MTKIKICGITNISDAMKCAEAGADALGLVFASSPRQVTPQIAQKICRELPNSVSKVGVFVNENRSNLLKIDSLCRLDYVQLHGQEDLDYLRELKIPFLKVFRVKDESVLLEIESFKLNLFMLDTYLNGSAGGGGKSFDWNVAQRAKRFGQFFLSGGLTPENIRTALEMTKPYGVDVSSGVESLPGKKDLEKVKRFVQEVRRWDFRIT